jgi:diguanylate cyclase (GGDEF)-like protein/PAS domain S-box-containing protein
VQGPVIDIVLLLLLILFLGSQLGERPKRVYRFWFAGWVFILLSYVVWAFKLTRPVWVAIQDSIRFDFLLLGLLLFMMSFLASAKGLWKTVGMGLIVGLPGVALIDAQQFGAVPRWAIVAAVLCWEAYGIRSVHVLVPRGRNKTRLALFAICGVCMVAIPVYLRMADANSLQDCACVEVLLCTAVLYGGGLRRRSLAVVFGMAGFVLWAAFYLLSDAWGHHPQQLQELYQMWSVPKFIVGFSMILKMMEDASEENAQLAADFGSIYKGHFHPMWIQERESGRCLSVNAAALRKYGYTQEEFLALDLATLETPEDAETESVQRTLPDAPDGRRVRHQRKDGRMLWMNVVERELMFQGKEARLVMARDITERLKINQELAHQAHHDVLTGLPNRSLLADRIQQSMARCGRDGRKAVLLMIDVDHFKRINDTYGHAAGDECLQVVAARLAAKIRQVDTLARIGGEEFAAIIGGLQQVEDAGKIAESLLRALDEPIRLGESEEQISVSIGVAIYPDDGGDVATLHQRSDEALYAAKHAGRNCAVLASERDHVLRRGRQVVAAAGVLPSGERKGAEVLFYPG